MMEGFPVGKVGAHTVPEDDGTLASPSPFPETGKETLPPPLGNY